VTRAIDKDSHIGYQTWHRELDERIVNWLEGNRYATQDQFVEQLKKFYKDPDIAKRFPDFAKDLENWIKTLPTP